MSSNREPVLRVMPRPSDINANGHIFGGWVLSQMDIAGGIVASRRAGGGRVATVAIEAMEFIAPILMHDVISLYAEVVRVGRTSLAIDIEVTATRGGEQQTIKVTAGRFTFVAIDGDARPRPID